MAITSNWLRWNVTSHIFEYSTDNGATYVPLPLNASILNEGSLNPAVIPGGGGSSIPAGSILAFGGGAAPSGYLLCNGQAVSRTTYAALFAAIATAYGVGDNSSTFNVPDLQQKFPLGKAVSGTGAALGAIGGAIDHIHSAPQHNHSIPTHTHPLSGTAAATATVVNMQTPVGSPASMATVTHTHAVTGTATAQTADVTGTNAAANTGLNNPPFQVVNYIIKT
jgi:microcystin-dependent protein